MSTLITPIFFNEISEWKENGFENQRSNKPQPRWSTPLSQNYKFVVNKILIQKS